MLLSTNSPTIEDQAHVNNLQPPEGMLTDEFIQHLLPDDLAQQVQRRCQECELEVDDEVYAEAVKQTFEEFKAAVLTYSQQYYLALTRYRFLTLNDRQQLRSLQRELSLTRPHVTAIKTQIRRQANLKFQPLPVIRKQADLIKQLSQQSSSYAVIVITAISGLALSVGILTAQRINALDPDPKHSNFFPLSVQKALAHHSIVGALATAKNLEQQQNLRPALLMAGLLSHAHPEAKTLLHRLEQRRINQAKVAYHQGKTLNDVVAPLTAILLVNPNHRQVNSQIQNWTKQYQQDANLITQAKQHRQKQTGNWWKFVLAMQAKVVTPHWSKEFSALADEALYAEAKAANQQKQWGWWNIVINNELKIKSESWRKRIAPLVKQAKAARPVPQVIAYPPAPVDPLPPTPYPSSSDDLGWTPPPDRYIPPPPISYPPPVLPAPQPEVIPFEPDKGKESTQ